MALKKRHLKAYKEWAKDDPAMELLDADQIKQYVNSDLYLGGYYRKDWGHIQPINLCIGEARAAEQMGAHIFEQSKVSKITYGKNPAVHTEKGIAKAKYVILCGMPIGSFRPYLDARVLPSTSCIIATQPLTEEQIQQTLPKMCSL